MKLRDRDAIVTKEGLLFRVYGYNHPPNGYICDPEYVSPKIFESKNPKAKRGKNKTVFYKFFEDEGLKFIFNKFPKYTLFYWPLQKCLVGVKNEDIIQVRKPETILKKLLKKQANDKLIKDFKTLFSLIISSSSLEEKNFGIFGSLLHGFYHSNFSDLDFIIYGKKNTIKLCDILKNLYSNNNSLKNEFENMQAVKSKNWKFINYSLKEYVWHQKRKLIYFYYNSENTGKVVKAEFEPVRSWKEIVNEYSPFTRVFHIGWIKALAEIVDDTDSLFIPSIYKIEIKEILTGPKIDEIKRIISYMEEFRMQAKKGEDILVEGNLEKVVSGTNVFYQISLSYGQRYYEQALKVNQI